jgi:hypothetical protein
MRIFKVFIMNRTAKYPFQEAERKGELYRK